MVTNLSFFLLPFLSSLAIALTLLTFLIFFSKKRLFVDGRNSDRHLHQKNVSRFGGIAIIIAFIIGVIADGRLVLTTPLKIIIFASLAILAYGLIDDIKQLKWKWQLLFQILLASSVYYFGIKLEYITNPFGEMYFFNSGFAYILGLVISISWIVFLMNAMNWVDGVDGVSGIVTLIAIVTIFFLSLKPEVNQPPVAIVTAALAGTLIAFLFYNFHPAKIMAGTSGSMFMGFILATLAIFAGAKIATTLMVLFIPVVDALWVLGERMYFKKSIFEADRRHLHFRLLEMGWSVRRIFLYYFLVTALISMLSLRMRATGKLATILIAALLLIAIMVLLAKKFIESENLKKHV